jgi:hypothetical protein
MKFRTVGAALFHADKQANSHFSPILRTRLKAAHSCRITTGSMDRFQRFARTYCLHFHRAWNPRHLYCDCWSLTGHNIRPKDILHTSRLITLTFVSPKHEKYAHVTIKTDKLCMSVSHSSCTAFTPASRQVSPPPQHFSRNAEAHFCARQTSFHVGLQDTFDPDKVQTSWDPSGVSTEHRKRFF